MGKFSSNIRKLSCGYHFSHGVTIVTRHGIRGLYTCCVLMLCAFTTPALQAASDESRQSSTLKLTDANHVLLASIDEKFTSDSSYVHETLDSLLSTATLSQDDHLLAEVLHQMGRFQKKLLQLDAALEALRRADRLAVLHDLPGLRGKIRRELGGIFTMRGDNLTALEHYLISIEAAERAEDHRTAGASYSLVANIFRVLGDYHKAIEYTLLAEKNYALVDFREGEAWILYTLGNIYNDLDLIEDAVRSFTKSLEIYTEIHEKDGNPLGVAICLDQLGLLEADRGNDSVAMTYYDRSHEIYTSVQNIFGMTRVLKNKGILAYNQHEYEKALDLLQQACDLSFQSQDLFGRPILNKYIGLALIKKGQVMAGMDSLDKALEAARQSRQQKIEHNLLGVLGNLHFEEGNLASSIEHYRMQSTLSDSLQSRSSLGRVAELVNIYEMAQSREEVKNLTLQNKMKTLELEKHRNLQFLLIGGTLSALLFVIILSYFYFSKRRLLNEKMASESRYRQMFYSNQAIKLIIDPNDGQILEANQAAADFYGYSTEQLAGMNISGINTLAGPDLAKSLESASKSSEQHFHFKHRLANGEIRSVEVYSGPIEIEDRKVLFSIIHDITDREQARDQLRESEKRLRSIVKSSPTPLVLTHPGGEIFDVNDKFKELFGYELSDVKSEQQWWQAFYPDKDYREKVRTAWREGLSSINSAGDEMGMQTWEIHTKAGKKRTVEFHSVLLGDMLLVAMLDVTERLQAETDRMQYERRLSQSQKLEALGVMVGGVAHEFNNILQSIFLYTEIVDSQLPPDSEIKEDLSHVIGNSRRAKTMIDHILTFSRKSEIKLKRQVINPIIEEALQFTRASMPAEIQIDQHLDEQTSAILCDQTQIHQIVINLCNNARQAIGDASGKVDVVLKMDTLTLEGNTHPGPWVILEVTDSGKGMDPETIERIFDPFFTTKRVGEGTGLGLSVIHGIIQMMDGHIQVASEPGVGTTVSVFFPSQELENGTEGSPEPEKAQAKRTRVLVVDDEKAIRRASRTLLTKEGYDVTTSRDGESALALITEKYAEFDIYIFDLSMPKLNGLELSRKVLEIDPDTPIVISSGIMDAETETALSDLGVKTFLRKPWKTEELVKIIGTSTDT